MENVMEKYKKKLEEAADLRQAAKVCCRLTTGILVSLNPAVIGKTKRRSGRQERVLGGRVSQGGRIQTAHGVLQEPNCRAGEQACIAQ